MVDHTDMIGRECVRARYCNRQRMKGRVDEEVGKLKKPVEEEERLGHVLKKQKVYVDQKYVQKLQSNDGLCRGVNG